MLKILIFLILFLLSLFFLFAVEIKAEIPQPIIQKPIDAITPEKLDFRLYMDTDANHQAFENMVPSFSVSLIERAKRENVIALLSPLMRLNVEHLRTLSSGKISHVEGVFTMGDLEVSEGKALTAFLKSDQPLLLESGHWNHTMHCFEFIYRRPGVSQSAETITLRLSNINVKSPTAPIGQYLGSIVRAPEGTQIFQPAHNQKKNKKHRGDSQTLPNPTQPPNPNAPPPGPTFINPNNYSDPPPPRRHRRFW
ncbi:MAG: hypothetical protein K2W94_03285 [Alphaproteobacteria bacterium]|nr:hypothetical protein [Alphaproteobacteria bacterium]